MVRDRDMLFDRNNGNEICGAVILAVPCTGYSRTEFDDTRGYMVQLCCPDDEHMVLETCRGMK